MKYSAKLWLRLDAEQMEMIDRFRASSKLKTITGAIRHLIQNGLDREVSRYRQKKMVGALSVLYDCDTEGLARELSEIQLKGGDIILSKTRLHLDPRLCLKVYAIRGPHTRICGLLDRLLAWEGVANAWFCECQSGVIKTKCVRKALTSSLAESRWASAGSDMILAMPLVLTCGAERLWRQLLAMRPDGHEIAASFSVHLNRNAFLHVAVFKKPADADAALFPLSLAKTQSLSAGRSAALRGADGMPSARIGNVS